MKRERTRKRAHHQPKEPKQNPMKNRYEGLLVLNVKGNEEGAKDVIDRLEGEFKKEGAKIEQVQKMDRRQFTYVAGPLDSGYFVNFIFSAEPASVDKLRARFKLDEDVYRQHYQKLRAKKAEKAEKAA
jgi:small subunit ribosomal protein S6